MPGTHPRGEATDDGGGARSAERERLAASLEEQQRRAENERARLVTIIENLPDAVLVVDSGGGTVLANKAYELTVGRDGFRAVDDDGTAVTADTLRRRVASGETFALQLHVTDESGRPRWYEVDGRPIAPGTDGAGDGILVVRDTTDLSLRRLQEHFVAMVAHELRTPLTALRGYVQMLAREAGGPLARPAALATSEAERLSRLVDHLYEVARLENIGLHLDRQRVDLCELVEQSVELARSVSRTHRLSIECPSRGIHVVADPGRLRQVLLNLVSNAVVHAPDSPDVRVRVRRRGRWAEVEVEDHGPGIPAEVQSRLFERFQDRRAGGGLGLGLYISKRIAEAHGGTIEVASVPGLRTAFTVRLPLSSASAGS